MKLGEMLSVRWVFGPPYNYDKRVFITSFEEVESALSERVKSVPDELWVVYYMPDGAQAFMLSRPVPTDRGVSIMTSMKCDDDYVRLCLAMRAYFANNSSKNKFWMTTGNGTSNPQLEARLRGYDGQVKKEFRYFQF